MLLTLTPFRFMLSSVSDFLEGCPAWQPGSPISGCFEAQQRELYEPQANQPSRFP